MREWPAEPPLVLRATVHALAAGFEGSAFQKHAAEAGLRAGDRRGGRICRRGDSRRRPAVEDC